MDITRNKGKDTMKMTGEDFCKWLDAMKEKGFNKQKCGEFLGRGAPWVSRAQTKGADKAINYACAAILAGMRPFAPQAPTSADGGLSRQRSKHPNHV